MRRRLSLRLRVALSLAALGALLSLLLAFGVHLAAQDVTRRLIDQTLTAELEDYISRRARNPASLPPETANLRGYLVPRGAGDEILPAPLRALPSGRHEVEIDGMPHRVAVAEHDGERYVVLFNEERQRRREQRFLGYLIAAAATMTLFAGIGGRWLAGRVIAPVTQLAHTLGKADPESPPRLVHELAAGDKIDELDELARAFDRYVARLAAFVERERNFASDASHELRTPLAVIRGAVEVLADDPNLDEAQRRRIARIDRAAAEMTELITSLLMLAREESPRVDEPCNAGHIAADCVARYQTTAQAHGSTIELVVEAPVQLQVPASLFAIVVANLVRNAVAHTRNGRIAIELDARRLRVTDTGSGIAEDMRDRLFDRHARGPDSKGTGIGLSLVRQICERLGWSIALESDRTGTVATVSLGQSTELTPT